MIRPLPPEHLCGGFGLFEPTSDVLRWARSTFINDDAPLMVSECEPLQQAEIGFLWTNTPNEKNGRMILGTCRLMPPNGNKWTVGPVIQQLDEWFPDRELDFLITLYAPACAEMDDASFCALVLHELLHAGQRIDKYGAPAFDERTGKPQWAMRAHDLEEFVTVVEMFGTRAAGAEAFVQAALRGPTVSQAQMDIACGNCMRVAA
jgi:hypothetical protein